MKKIQFFLCLAVFGSFLGLNAAQRIGFINDSGQDLYVRIRTQRGSDNVSVIHPLLYEDTYKILNPISNNPEIFLFRNKGVIFIPINSYVLGNDLRIRLWKTDYKPRVDGALKTSPENANNSFSAYIYSAKTLKSKPQEFIVYSVKGDKKFHEVDYDVFKQRLAQKEFKYVIDLKSTPYEAYFGSPLEYEIED